MAQLSFSAQVDDWCRRSEQRLTAVFRESTQRLVAAMQTPVGGGGNMPVDTGFMRNSAQASTEAPIPINPNAVPVKPPGHVEGTLLYPYTGQDVTLVILGAELGQTIYVTYTAAYARVQEYRRGFVRLAAQQWPQIVEGVIRDAKARSGAQ